jgi:hypothetical protein
MDITWNGKYGYDDHFDPENTFAFILKVDDNEGSFHGIALEEEFTGLTGEAASVKGFADGDHISFVKKYPFRFDTQDDGAALIDRQQRGHEVVYDGYFNSETGVWEGTWEIQIDEIKIAPHKYRTSATVGFWQMNRD